MHSVTRPRVSWLHLPAKRHRSPETSHPAVRYYAPVLLIGALKCEDASTKKSTRLAQKIISSSETELAGTVYYSSTRTCCAKLGRNGGARQPPSRAGRAPARLAVIAHSARC